MMRRFLEWVLDEGKIILGWNVVYDIAVMLGYGFEELVMQCRFMDGMLIWRHLDIEPEWDETGRTKRHYGLKLAVDTFLPQYSGYQEDIDFHTDDVEKLTKLHDYNIKDNIFTLRIAKMLWAADAAPAAGGDYRGAVPASRRTRQLPRDVHRSHRGARAIRYTQEHGQGQARQARASRRQRDHYSFAD